MMAARAAAAGRRGLQQFDGDLCGGEHERSVLHESLMRQVDTYDVVALMKGSSDDPPLTAELRKVGCSNKVVHMFNI